MPSPSVSQTSPMTSLKKLISHMPEVERRLLSSFLSTSYAKSMATQGHLALALDRAAALASSRSTSRRRREMMDCFYTNVSDALEEIQSLSDLLGEAESISSAAML